MSRELRGPSSLLGQIFITRKNTKNNIDIYDPSPIIKNIGSYKILFDRRNNKLNHSILNLSLARLAFEEEGGVIMKRLTAVALVALLSLCLTTPCFSDGPNENPPKAHTQIETDQR